MSYTSAKSRPSYTFDANLQFKDAGLVAASAQAQVAGADKIINVGNGRFNGKLVIDATAIEVDSSNELYSIEVQGSTSSTFASGNVVLCERQLGHSSVTGSSASDAAGRYTLDFSNVDMDGNRLPYLRVYTRVAGTIATGINYTAWATKR
jgi:hypothetical protein